MRNLLNIETGQSNVTPLKRSVFNIVFTACSVQMFRVSICNTVCKAFLLPYLFTAALWYGKPIKKRPLRMLTRCTFGGIWSGQSEVELSLWKKFRHRREWRCSYTRFQLWL